MSPPPKKNNKKSLIVNYSKIRGIPQNPLNPKNPENPPKYGGGKRKTAKRSRKSRK